MCATADRQGDNGPGAAEPSRRGGDSGGGRWGVFQHPRVHAQGLKIEKERSCLPASRSLLLLDRVCWMRCDAMRYDDVMSLPFPSFLFILRCSLGLVGRPSGCEARLVDYTFCFLLV